MNVFKFKCVPFECGGKCCNGATHVTAKELKRFYDKAPVTFMLHFFTEENVRKTKRDFIKKSGVPFKMFVNGEEVKLYAVGEFLIGSLKDEKCVFLTEEGLCGVHGEKPLNCKAVPFNAFVPYGEMESVFNDWLKRGYPCTNRPEGKIIWNRKKPYKVDDKSFSDAYFAYRKALKENVPFTFAILSLFERTGSFPVEIFNSETFVRFGDAKIGVVIFPSESLFKTVDIDVKDFVEKQIKILSKTYGEENGELKCEDEVLRAQYTIYKDFLKDSKTENIAKQ